MSAAPPTGTVTFLFTDIEGSTERWERQRAAMEAALARHNAILTGAIEERGGYVFKTVGDAFCASFAHASDAIEAAIEAQRLLHGERFQLEGDEPLLVRMGIHTGLVELKDGDYFGRPVNRVARLMSVGHGGQVLVSLATQQLVRDALPEGAALSNLGVHRLKDLEHTEHIYRLQAPGMPEVDTPPDTAERLGAGQRGALEGVLADAECPYRGLHAFREEDARFFFGREVFTTRLVDALTSKPMVGVIGPSGSGKSSVVYAGMLPELRALNGEARAGGWTVLKLRPGAEPFHAIAGVLVPLLEGEMTETARLVETRRMAEALLDGTLDLGHVLQRARDKRGDLGSLLFIADQFEELYTLCPDVSVQRAFQDLLFEAVHEPNGSGPVKLALTLRADFMGHATAYRPFSDAMQDHNVILGPMNRDELMRTIVKPAELQGRAFEAGLVERIADDVGEEAGALPLLEFALTKLWEKQEAGWLTHEAYESIGRVEGAVARHADAVYDGLSEPDQELARNVFVQMVRPGEGTEDTRRVAKKDELGDEGWSLVRKLADARLVVTNRDESGRETAEVVHEALIRTWGRLTEWMGEDRQFRMWQERLRFAIRQWEDADRDEGALLRGVPLSEASQWLEERPAQLTSEETAFVDASRAAEDARVARESRNRRRLRFALVAVALSTTAGLLISLDLARRTAQSRDEARSVALAATSRQLMSQDQRDSAMAVAVAALEESPRTQSPEVELALADASYAPQILAVVDGLRAETAHEDCLVCGHRDMAAFNAVGDELIAAFEDGSLQVLDGQELRPLRRIAPEPGMRYIAPIALSPDDSTIAAAMVDEEGTRFHIGIVDRDRMVLRQRLEGHDDAVNRIVFDPTGDRLISVSEDGTIRAWSVEDGGLLDEVSGHDGQVVFDIESGPNEGAWLTAGHDGKIRMWELIDGRLAENDEINLSSGGNWRADIAWSPDGATVAFNALGTGLLEVLDVVTGEKLVSSSFSFDTLPDLRFTSDGAELFAPSSSSGLIRFINPGNLQQGGQLVVPGGRVRSGALSPDGRRAATVTEKGTMHLWAVASPVEDYEIDAHDGWIMSIDVDAEGRRAMSATWENADGIHDRQVVVWDLERQREELEIPSRVVRAAKFLPDADRLLVKQSGGARVFNASTGDEVLTLKAIAGNSPVLAVHPSGRFVAAEDTGSVWIADLASGEIVKRFPRVPDAVSEVDVDFGPDGAHLVQTGPCPPPSDAPACIVIWSLVDSAISASVPIPWEAKETLVNVAFDPSGDRIAASSDKSLWLWSWRAGDELQRIDRSEPIQSLAFDPSGDYLAIAAGQHVWVWDVLRGAFVRSYRGHEKVVKSVVFDPSGRYLLSGDLDGSLRRWHFHRGLNELLRWVADRPIIPSLACHERTLYRTSQRCTANDRLERAGHEVVQRLLENASSVEALDPEVGEDSSHEARAAECSIVLSERGDARFGVQSGTIGPCEHDAWTLRSEGPAILDVNLLLSDDVVEEDEPNIDAGARSGPPSIVVRDAGGNTVAHSVAWVGQKAPAANVAGLAVDELEEYRIEVRGARNYGARPYTMEIRESPLAPVIGAASFGTTITGTLPISGGIRYGLPRRPGHGVSAQLAVEGDLLPMTPGRASSEISLRPLTSLLIGDEEEGIAARVESSWGLTQKVVLATPPDHDEELAYLELRAREKRLDPGPSSAYTFTLKVVPVAALERTIGDSTGPDTPKVYGMATSSDGSRIASGDETGAITIWEIESGEPVARLEDVDRGHTSPVFALAYHPDDGRLLSASTGEVLLWDIESGAVLRRLEGHATDLDIYGLAFHPDGRRAISGSHDKSAIVWDTETGEVLHRLQGHGDLVHSVTFSPDGRRVYSASDDTLILVWDVETGEEVQRLEGHGDDVRRIAVTPDGQQLFSAAHDGVPLLWDLATGEPVRRFEGHVRGIIGAAVSPDGSWGLTGGVSTGDYTARLWNLATGAEVAHLVGHEDRVREVAFTPDGQRAITNSLDGTVRIWDVSEIIAEHEASAGGAADSSEPAEPAPVTTP